MKPFPRRFIVDLDEIRCYALCDTEASVPAVVALITDADTEQPLGVPFHTGTATPYPIHVGPRKLRLSMVRA